MEEPRSRILRLEMERNGRIGETKLAFGGESFNYRTFGAEGIRTTNDRITETSTSSNGNYENREKCKRENSIIGRSGNFCSIIFTRIFTVDIKEQSMFEAEESSRNYEIEKIGKLQS